MKRGASIVVLVGTFACVTNVEEQPDAGTAAGGSAGGIAAAGGSAGGTAAAGGTAGGLALDAGGVWGRGAGGEVLLPDGGMCAGLGGGPPCVACVGGGSCCPGLSGDEFLNDNSCRLSTCQALNGPCGATPCCSGLTCTNGQCVASAVCTPPGGFCRPSELDTCCPGAVCVIDWLDAPRCFARPPDWLCGPYVLTAGRMACRTESDCCAQACDAGVCVGPLR